MIKIYADGDLVYDSRLRTSGKDYSLHGLTTTKGLNKGGTAQISMPPGNPIYSRFVGHRTVVDIFQDGLRKFRGRALYPSDDWLNCRTWMCEGELCFFQDGTSRPYLYQDTPQAIFTAVVEDYNSQVEAFKRFKVGTITVTDPNGYVRLESETAEQTLATLNKLRARCGGYITFASDPDTDERVVNWLAEVGVRSTQPIEFGKNLLDFARTGNNTDLVTVVIPYGAKDESTGKRVDIKSVNNGLDYIQDDEAVALRGTISRPVYWDDVTEPANLLRKAQEYLFSSRNVVTSLSLTAVDLSKMDRSIDSFQLGDYIPVISKPHAVDDYFQLTEYTEDLLNPKNSQITLGADVKTLTGQTNLEDKDNSNRIESSYIDLKEKVESVQNSINDITSKVEGIEGTYFYIRYSEYADGHIMTDAPTDTTQYMGTCSTSSPTAPTNYKEYTWCRVRGEDGGEGTPGQPGEDGKSQYFHVKYSNDGKTFTSNNGETLGDWMGTCVNETEADPTEFSAYTWRKIVGEDGTNGIDGVDGHDGQSSYFFVKYSANADGNPMTEVPDDNTKYMGTCSTNIDEAPTDPGAYTWTQCRGNDGTNGIPGPAGADGRTQYLHIKYSDDGKTFTADNGEELGAYIGTLVDFNEADSTNFNDYTWKKFTGDVDVGGRNYLQKSNPADWIDEWVAWGTNTTATVTDGWLQVTHGGSDSSYGYYPPKISTFPAGDLLLSFDAYSESATELNYNYIMGSNGNTKIGSVNITREPTRYVIPIKRDAELSGCSILLGSTAGNSFYVKDIKVEVGNVPTDWTPAPEDTGAAIDGKAEAITQTMLELRTEVLNTAEEFTVAALKDYVETSEYEEFRDTTESNLTLTAERLALGFEETTEQINNVNGDLQTVSEKIEKYFEFTTNGLIIKAGEGSMNLVLDNDIIRFVKNGQEFGWWDGVDFHTGNIVVEVNERAQFGNFAFVPRSNGSLSFLKVGE